MESGEIGDEFGDRQSWSEQFPAKPKKKEPKRGRKLMPKRTLAASISALTIPPLLLSLFPHPVTTHFVLLNFFQTK